MVSSSDIRIITQGPAVFIAVNFTHPEQKHETDSISEEQRCHT